MAKKKKSKRRNRASQVKPDTSSYADREGNVLVLRQQLSGGTIDKIRSEMGNEAADVEDIWQRRTELLFERLAVSWEIAGLPIDEQSMLLGRYRMADSAERSWVRQTIDRHLDEFIPELAD